MAFPVDDFSDVKDCSSVGTPTTIQSPRDVESGEPKERRGLCTRLARCLNPWPIIFGTGINNVETYPTITRSLDHEPTGYSRVALFQSSDRCFMQYRSFGYLRARVLSDLQYEIEQKEQLLNHLDDWDKSERGDPRRLECKGRDNKKNRPELLGDEFALEFEQTRPQVLTELRQKLSEYDQLLLSSKEVTALQRPSTRDYRSVRAWFLETRPLVGGEDTFIQRKEDIITLRSGRESVAFDDFVERRLVGLNQFLVKCFGCRSVQKMFLTPELEVKSSDERIQYFDAAKVNRLVNVLITVIIFVLMIIPVVALYELTNIGSGASPFEAMGLLMIFTLLFGSAMSALTKATRQELFAASAAYCAILVVFMTNLGVQSVSIVPS